MPVPSSFTAEENTLIVAMLAQGRKPNEIAATLGKKRSTLVSHIEKGYHLTGAKVRPWYEGGNKLVHDDGQVLRLESLPSRVLAVSCTQFPYHHPDTFDHLDAVMQKYAPDFVVMLGDEADNQFLKKAFMDADAPGPNQQLDLTLECMARLYKTLPKAICLNSNHVSGRIGYAATQGNIPSRMLRAWRDIVGAPKEWEWREYLIMGRWLFEHGDGITKGARGSLQEQTIKRFNEAFSIMRGHFHEEMGPHIKPIWYSQTEKLHLFYAGCYMNKAHVKYTKAGQMVGCAMIDDGVPVSLPMERDPFTNRWTGKLIRC